MRQTKYDFQLIDTEDSFADLPEQFNHNVEVMVERMDWMSECMTRIQREIDMIRSEVRAR